MKHQLKWLILLLALLALPVQAQPDFTAPIIERLEQDGFTVSKVRRTLLGRILIVAKNGIMLREIILNRKTGAILHDHSFSDQQTQLPNNGAPVTPDTGNTPSPPDPTDGGFGGMGGGGFSGGGFGGGGMGGGGFGN